MKKSIISVIDENDLNLFKKQYINLVDIQDEISKLEDNIPDKRKKGDYKEWKERINFLIDMYNARSKYKTYTKVK